jgi:hypothetical protein
LSKLTYDIVTVNRAGKRTVHRYASDVVMAPGDVVVFEGRYWLIVEAEEAAGEEPPRLTAAPARYRIRLKHQDGREELGALRRFRRGSPRLGHAFTTPEDGQPASWQVVEERLAGERESVYLELLAERDYAEVEELPDHELEHALAGRDAALSAAVTAFERAAGEGLAVELVALEPGELPDWEAARRYVVALILEEIEDDLLELCGVRPGTDPRETWLDTVKERLLADLEQFSADIDGDHDQIEEWDYAEGRIFASVGSPDDEADPSSGHGWMCRLVDSGALAAAGFEHVRKSELWPADLS